MLCEKCKKNNATVRIMRKETEGYKEYALCQACAYEKVTQNPASMLKELLSKEIASEASARVVQDTGEACSFCGITYKQFRQVGRLGCGQCYDTFSDKLETVMTKVHNANSHFGKAPLVSADLSDHKLNLRSLRQQLNRALESEDFKSAVTLRDQIRDLEKELGFPQE
jgi:protein arginine kinase activator